MRQQLSQRQVVDAALLQAAQRLVGVVQRAAVAAVGGREYGAILLGAQVRR